MKKAPKVKLVVNKLRAILKRIAWYENEVQKARVDTKTGKV
mgnify:CR=1 FL=1